MASLTNPDRTCETTVRIAARLSTGGVVMIDMSRKLPTASCNVRGIGVAALESVSTSTDIRICLIRSLCVTPKRCSSV